MTAHAKVKKLCRQGGRLRRWFVLEVYSLEVQDTNKRKTRKSRISGELKWFISNTFFEGEVEVVYHKTKAFILEGEELEELSLAKTS